MPPSSTSSSARREVNTYERRGKLNQMLAPGKAKKQKLFLAVKNDIFVGDIFAAFLHQIGIERVNFDCTI